MSIDSKKPSKLHKLRIVLIVLLVALVFFVTWFIWSFNQAVQQSDGEPLEVVAATWARDHNLGSVVAFAENIYYQHIAVTPVGGEPTESATIPDAASPQNTEPIKSPIEHLTPPADIVSPASTKVTNEGVWQPTKATVAGVPAIYVTRVRPDNTHTSVLVSMMWIDTKLAKVGLVPGYEEPGGPSPTDGAMPRQWQDTALASFNGAFRLQDSQGGYYYNGKTISDLKNGRASAVLYKDGSVDVGRWGTGTLKMNPDVVSVRQNLDLIVDGGKAQTNATDSGADWGATTDGESLAWRSAVGQRADGSLVYVGSPSLSANTLAAALVRAGVQRAMVLDMNNWWVAGFYYNHTNGSIKCSKLDPAIQEGCDRFLNRYKRDSFAVYGKTP